MSRFKRAVIGFMVVANLGIYSAIALWLAVDGGLPTLPTVEVVAALAAATSTPGVEHLTSEAATAQPVLPPAATSTAGWTPPAESLAPLPIPTEDISGASPLFEATLTPSATAPAPAGPPTTAPETKGALPVSATVEGVIGHRQALPLSCESRSAADWAAFFGVEIDEMTFLNALPRSDDPDRGFVGDVSGEWGSLPPNAYGVHAGPVARLLRDYGLPARSVRYSEWDSVRGEIAAGRPVLVWVTGHVEEGEGVTYTASDGRRTIVARFEHTVIVIGYDEDTVLVVDGANTYRRTLNRFLASWGALRNMAVMAEP